LYRASWCGDDRLIIRWIASRRARQVDCSCGIYREAVISVIWCGCEAVQEDHANSSSALLLSCEQGVTAPEEERTSMRDIRSEARRLVASGLSVIPICPDGTKRPALDAWRPYQQVRPNAVTLATWFHHGEGLAVIGGAVSGHLEILDFDAPELFAPWCAVVEQLCSGLVARLPLVQTPSDGRHLYYRCQSIARNLKLAQRLGAHGTPETVIETRGEGGYAIAPPSPPACHPRHHPYQLFRGDLAAIPTVTMGERACLLQMARAFNTYVTPRRVVSGSPAGMVQHAGGHRPGDVFNAQADWRRLLEPHGWTCVGQHGEVTYWRRPGKIGPGISATTNYAGRHLLYVFSTNAAPFEPDTAYTPFAAYALLEHRGDFPAAARVMARRGYGERLPGPRQQPVDPWLGPREHRHGIPLAVRRLPPGATPHA
jgi:putative DNA primase/helicase